MEEASISKNILLLKDERAVYYTLIEIQQECQKSPHW